jgi:hypothetical protein
LSGGDHNHRTVRRETDVHTFVRVGANALDETRQSAAPDKALLGRDTRAIVESTPIGKRQCLVQQAFEISTVVGLSGCRLIGDRFRWNEIAPTQIDRIHAELASRLFD